MFTGSSVVERLREGDEKAFREIYLRYWKRLLLTAHRKVSSREEAEELVQNLFVSLWEKREEAVIENVERYLFTSLKYLVLNHIRSRMMEARYVSYAERTQSQKDNGTEASVALSDLAEALEAGLSCLPEKTMVIFKMNRQEHHSVKEIAQSLNLPTRTVEYHLSKALKALRIHLKEFVSFILIGFVSLV